MSTITIRLPEELKARLARATKAAGTTSQAFILEAIAEKITLAEQRADFHAVAEQRYAQFLETGEAIPWEEVRTLLKQRIAGMRVERLAARKLTR
ncbi:ribbon-helix-helix protein, CopG family [Luteimonas sp. SJ-92]|uniref:Ribbon-helix-helix protein, CopG family n=1 Tax=Luteimonas salinisoli TaxID=2752307 RepID=A0A853JEP1_9GAMM|nr:DUF6290 family protein [Luteimonas salinisoli]NZA27793.1 ribbon-helix-helix protein, CopG family [Luteimonas salinisoli]